MCIAAIGLAQRHAVTACCAAGQPTLPPATEHANLRPALLQLQLQEATYSRATLGALRQLAVEVEGAVADVTARLQQVRRLAGGPPGAAAGGKDSWWAGSRRQFSGGSNLASQPALLSRICLCRAACSCGSTGLWALRSGRRRRSTRGCCRWGVEWGLPGGAAAGNGAVVRQQHAPCLS